MLSVSQCKTLGLAHRRDLINVGREKRKERRGEGGREEARDNDTA